MSRTIKRPYRNSRQSCKCSYCASIYIAERCPSCGASHPVSSDRIKVKIGPTVTAPNERVIKLEIS